MPKLNGILETSLYVDDMDRAAAFYEEVLGLATLAKDSRFRAYDVAGRSVLLVFVRGATLDTVTLPGGTIPPHDGHGPLHMAFAISADDLGPWEERLARHGVGIEGGPGGRAGRRASTSATRTGTCSSWQRPVCGRLISQVRCGELDVRSSRDYIYPVSSFWPGP